MKSLPTKPALILLFGVNAFICWGTDDESESAFFIDKEEALRQEYLECTNDSRRVDIKYVIEWKRKMEALKKTPKYAELLRDYKKATGNNGASPCALMEWKARRKAVQDSAEQAIVDRILDNNEAADIAEGIKALPLSKFDFARIPFGVSKSAFTFLFANIFNIALSEKETFLYAEAVPWNALPLLTAFFFDDENRFYKYEIESDALPADSVNKVVRPAADSLARVFERMFGTPTHSYRIGFFEIKSKELAIAWKWETPDYTAYIGFSELNYLYYAKAVVTNLKLLRAKTSLDEPSAAGKR